MDLKQIRLDHGWSQDQLAEISGVSTRTIQRIENGNAPSLETLKALAAGFDLSIEELKQKLTPSQPEAVPAGGNFKTAFKDWQSFGLHALLFVGVMTWLFLLQHYFALDHELVGFVALVWGTALASHLAKTLDKVSDKSETD